MKTHKDLEVWKKSIEFVSTIYRVTESFPRNEIFGLTSQIRRAAVSIPSNIAEGAARKGKVEFKYFLYISLSSAAEVDTQLLVSKNLRYLNKEDFIELLTELETISKMIQGLIRSCN